MTDQSFQISGRWIGPEHPPYVIGELSGNHNGDIGRALAIVEAIREAGADAVKLQSYTADTITLDHDGPGFLVEGGLWAGQRLYDLYAEAHTPWDWHEQLFSKADELGLTIFSSPFDKSAIEMLEALGCPAYKIASFEAADTALVRDAASTGKPLIISTGMVNEQEIQRTLDVARSAGASGVALLHCVSAYPAEPRDSNLLSIPVLGERFEAIAGLSDHTLGNAVSIASVALGACVIEKHITLSRAEGGVDAAFSLEPDELAALVMDCHIAWQARGQEAVGIQSAATPNTVFKRSLYAVKDIAAGETLSPNNVRSIRPSLGLSPDQIDRVMGRKAIDHIRRGAPLNWDMIE